jgi:hypothetical protein
VKFKVIAKLILTVGNSIMTSFILCMICVVGVIKLRRMRWTCPVASLLRNAYKILVGSPGGMRRRRDIGID